MRVQLRRDDGEIGARWTIRGFPGFLGFQDSQDSWLIVLAYYGLGLCRSLCRVGVNQLTGLCRALRNQLTTSYLASVLK